MSVTSLVKRVISNFFVFFVQGIFDAIKEKFDAANGHSAVAQKISAVLPLDEFIARGALYGKSKKFAKSLQVNVRPYLSDGRMGQPCQMDVSLLFTNSRLASGNVAFSCVIIDNECAKSRNFGTAQEEYRVLALQEARIRKLEPMAKSAAAGTAP
jgi:hypothetical protein